MLVHREALLACGGFDEALSCNEDSELVWRLRAGLLTERLRRHDWGYWSDARGP